MVQDSCFHSPGVRCVREYIKLSRCDVSLSFAMPPEYFKRSIPVSNLNIYPSVRGNNFVEIVLISCF